MHPPYDLLYLLLMNFKCGCLYDAQHIIVGLLELSHSLINSSADIYSHNLQGVLHFNLICFVLEYKTYKSGMYENRGAYDAYLSSGSLFNFHSKINKVGSCNPSQHI